MKREKQWRSVKRGVFGGFMFSCMLMVDESIYKEDDSVTISFIVYIRLSWFRNTSGGEITARSTRGSLSSKTTRTRSHGSLFKA